MHTSQSASHLAWRHISCANCENFEKKAAIHTSKPHPYMFLFLLVLMLLLLLQGSLWNTVQPRRISLHRTFIVSRQFFFIIWWPHLFPFVVGVVVLVRLLFSCLFRLFGCSAIRLTGCLFAHVLLFEWWKIACNFFHATVVNLWWLATRHTRGTLY